MIKAIVVDDEKWTRNVVRAFGAWDKLGIKLIAEAEDGEEALDLIKKYAPKIVITDMNMAGMNGVGLLKEIDELYDNIQLIVISGYDDFEYTKQAINSKVIDYILKPINTEELNKALEKCVDNIELMASKKTHIIYELVSPNVFGYIAEQKKWLEIYFEDENINAIAGLLDNVLSYLIKSKIDDRLIKKIIFDLINDFFKSIIAKNPTLISKEIFKILKRLENDSSNDSKLIDFTRNSNICINNCLEHIQSQRMKEKIDVIKQVRHYIDKHYKEDITLEKLANIFLISKEYLSSAFKQKYNENVTSYIVSLKMKKAKELILSEDQLSFKVISEIVGYKEVSYFYRVFKKYYGISPGQMQKQNPLD